MSLCRVWARLVTSTSMRPPAVGFTGAPNGDPQPLDKTISYCMDDPSYQPCTTMFTDGTTGWTSYCAGT